MMNFNRSIALFSALILTTGCTGSFSASQNPREPSQIAANGESSEPFNYDDYAAVLETYVNEKGFVDYQQLQANRQKLDAFNASLGRVSATTYESWNDREKIAFLINAYNAFTLQSIIDQDPLKTSIRDIPGVWKVRKFPIAGQEKTLDNIEHETLRKDFDEPRIHAALVCAAVSCPPLRREPYTGDRLDAQLDEQVQQWLASSHGLQIDRAEAQVYVSAIFDWFGKDWESRYGVEGKFTGNGTQRAVLNFVSQYVDSQDRNFLAGGDYKLKYLDYDWTLNIQN